MSRRRANTCQALSVIQAVFHYFTCSKLFNAKDNYSHVTDVDSKGERGHINCLKSHS